MGACCDVKVICSFEASDWISLVSIIVNSALAIWIVRTIQNRLTNRRVLKDHFIGEIKEIRSEYKIFLNNIYANKILPKTLIPWFKLMNIKVSDLMSLINTKYKIDRSKLIPYQRQLQELITNNNDFIKQFESSKPLIFSDNSRNQIIKFQQEHNQIFNELIIKINDSN